MTLGDHIRFNDSPSLKGREDRYSVVTVAVAPVLESWRASLFSFELLTSDGAIRTIDDLPIHERDKRVRIERIIADKGPLDRPVLGIGLLDNIEIGAGRDVFLTLSAHGLTGIEVHVPRSSLRDFAPYLIETRQDMVAV